MHKYEDVMEAIKKSLQIFPGLKVNSIVNKYGFKIEVSSIDNIAIDNDNLILSKSYGFTQNIVGMKFQYEKDEYEVKLFKPQNRKYPVIATNLKTKKDFRFTPSIVKNRLGGDVQINRIANLNKLVE